MPLSFLGAGGRERGLALTRVSCSRTVIAGIMLSEFWKLDENINNPEEFTESPQFIADSSEGPVPREP